ncbi:interferon alpha-inducible protein 27-like protein 2B [Physella acuta]|uniref:interferon alpha-inducible protein 27-like protein 2B n=1 Tax=Physella acuta TaxID=109671 RepID=UPI0027DB065A|nr:interferon alpha-inducible protein 27-like protein 2B [Physella acuta]
MENDEKPVEVGDKNVGKKKPDQVNGDSACQKEPSWTNRLKTGGLIATGAVGSVAVATAVAPALGFTAAGIAAGSIASGMMSTAATTGVGMGIVSTLQSVGVLGFGTAAKVLIASGGAVAVNKIMGNKINGVGESPEDPSNPSVSCVPNKNSNNVSKDDITKLSDQNINKQGTNCETHNTENEQNRQTSLQYITNIALLPFGGIASVYRVVASRVMGTGQSADENFQKK